MKEASHFANRSGLNGGHEACPNCGWPLTRQAEDKISAQSDSDPLLVPLAESIDFLAPFQKQGQDQRRHKRIKTDRIKGCLRVGNMEDIVDVHDISRRGLRFSSSRLYQAGTAVQVSAPFTIDGNNIFSAGRILRVHRRPTKLLPGVYGVELLP